MKRDDIAHNNPLCLFFSQTTKGCIGTDVSKSASCRT